VDALFESLKTDSFFGVRAEAANAIGKLKPRKVEAKLIAAAKGQDNRVKRACVRALKNYTGDEVRDFLLGFLSVDEKDYLINDAFNSLWKVDTSAFNAKIHWALNTDSHNDMLRRSAIRAISKQETDSSLAELKDLAEYGGTTWDARLSAVWALSGKVEDNPELLEWFADHLEDPNRNVRSASIGTVGRYGKKKHIELLENLYDPINADAIDDAIENLNKPKRKRSKKRGH